MATSFFETDGEAFRATELTRGPWDPGLQHFGPSAALLGRAIEGVADDGKRVARITFEILSPVPITALQVQVSIVRAGRRIDLVEAQLSDRDGRAYALARAWRMRVADLALPDHIGGLDEADRPGASGAALPPPDAASHRPFFLGNDVVGYHTATDWRFLSGAFGEPGPAIAWCRSLVSLVDAEPLSPLQRVLIVADSGNGISAVAAPSQLIFVNTDLTVALHREPTSEWIGMDSRTVLEPNGSGLASSVLHDTHGKCGIALQTLFVDLPPT